MRRGGKWQCQAAQSSQQHQRHQCGSHSAVLGQGLVGTQGILKSSDPPRTIVYFRGWPVVALSCVPGGAQVEQFWTANATRIHLHALRT